MPKITHFKPEMFTATEHTPAKEKAEWANRLASFIVNGFKPGDFTNLIYNRLNQCFGHIAHYNRDGFYSVWFATPEQQAKFIKYTLDFKSYGNPKYTFCDVEQAFQTWLADQKIQVKVETKAANERVYIALEDTADHALTILDANRTPDTVSTVVNQTVAFLGQFILEPLDGERVEVVKAKLSRKFTQDSIEFRLASISQNTNSFGHHGHVFIARDGETWQATKYRLTDDLKVGQSVTVKMQNGILNWMALGYEVPERIKNATDEQVARAWG